MQMDKTEQNGVCLPVCDKRDGGRERINKEEEEVLAPGKNLHYTTISSINTSHGLDVEFVALTTYATSAHGNRITMQSTIGQAKSTNDAGCRCSTGNGKDAGRRDAFT